MRQQSIEYEYTMVDSEITVDRIRGKSRRKNVLAVDSKKFEILASVAGRHQDEFKRNKGMKKYDVSSSDDSPSRWFAVFNDKNGHRAMLIFEPDQRMIDAVKIFVPRRVFDD